MEASTDATMDPMPMEPMMEEMGEMKEMKVDEQAAAAMMEAQITYTAVAVMSLASSALMSTRYWDSSVYTTANTALGNDNYKMLEQAFGYINVAFWTVATITQLLSWGSIATDINLMVWMIGGELGFFITMAYMMANWYLKSVLTTNIANSSHASESQSTLDQIKLQTAHVSAMEAMSSFELLTNAEAWGKYQWMNMSEEKQEAMKEDSDESDGEGESSGETEGEDEEQDPQLFAIWKMVHGF